MTRKADPLEKTPTESLLYDFDFADMLQVGETITGGTQAVVATPSGLTVGAPSLSGTKVQARISGGTAEVSYLLRCTVSTSAGNTREVLGDLRVTLQ